MNHSGWALDDDAPMTARLTVAFAFTVAAGLSVLFTIVWLLSDGLSADISLGGLIAPLMLGIFIAVAGAVYDATCGRLPFAWMCVVVAASILVLALVGAKIFELSTSQRYSLSPFVYLIGVPVYGALAWATLAIWPAPKKQEQRLFGPGENRGDWREEFIRAARVRGDLTEKHIEELANDAYARAEAAHRSVGEECGDPVRYARNLPKDRATAARRKLYFQLALVALAGIVFFLSMSGETKSAFGIGALTLWLAIVAVGALSSFFLWRKAEREQEGEAERTVD
ncbi:hypothetical protein M3B90_03035 [Dermabacter sp. p3-SID358]|uniref:hypothetical protein n=1 Tax=Dermabacter sp. p3-SID358 TaxID=2916114 RepID=UPI0021A9180A|nr:hypothetical protein [Dermabacter sp. p3-SID358]MCT1866503.1 hypothetical protein [Dermabacter sp. p3-SID358]